jgi:hypothetical protein
MAIYQTLDPAGIPRWAVYLLTLAGCFIFVIVGLAIMYWPWLISIIVVPIFISVLIFYKKRR